MRVFNRIIVTLGIVVLLALTIVFLIIPAQAIAAIRATLDAFERSLFVDQFYYIYLAALAVGALILLWLLWLEMRRPRRRTVRIKSTEGGVAQLGVESIAQSLEYRVDELAGVRRVKTDVYSRGRDVDVTVNLDTSPSVNIPVLTDEIVTLARDIIEGQLGVKIHGNVLVNVTHEPYPRGTMPPTGPLGEESVLPPRGPEAAPARHAEPRPSGASDMRIEPADRRPPLSPETPPAGGDQPEAERESDFPPLVDDDETRPRTRDEETI